MASYYEVLKLTPTASVEEIQAAIDEQYNQFLHLVNHQNPEVVEQANRALRQLEQIRVTLTDTDKRIVYDQSLNFGGLADPGAILASAGIAGPLTPPAPQPVAEEDANLKAWKCNQCGKANRVGSKICSKCGIVLARDCPNGCGNVVHLSDTYCSNCGGSVAEGLAKLQLKFDEDQKNAIEAMRTETRPVRNELDLLERFAEHVPTGGRKLEELNELLGSFATTNSRVKDMASFILFIVLVIGTCIGIVILFLESSRLLGLLVLALMAVVGWFGKYLINEALVKPRIRANISRATQRRQEYIRLAEQRIQMEQSKQFDPLSPKPYGPATV